MCQGEGGGGGSFNGWSGGENCLGGVGVEFFNHQYLWKESKENCIFFRLWANLKHYWILYSKIDSIETAWTENCGKYFLISLNWIQAQYKHNRYATKFFTSPSVIDFQRCIIKHVQASCISSNLAFWNKTKAVIVTVVATIKVAKKRGNGIFF